MEAVPRPIAVETTPQDPQKQAYRILHVAFVVVPIIAGLDQLTRLNLLADWDMYLCRQFAALSPLSDHGTMMVVGAIEIVAGVLVFFKPRYFAYLVFLWLWGIILNLLLFPGFYDIALRDFGLSLGALALARLASVYDA